MVPSAQNVEIRKLNVRDAIDDDIKEFVICKDYNKAGEQCLYLITYYNSGESEVSNGTPISRLFSLT